MKKLLILILALTVMLAFTACKDDVCKEHTDDDSNGICDVCETEIPDDGDGPGGKNEHTVHTDSDANGICDGCSSIFIDYAKPTVVGTILKSSLEKQFNAMRSMKIELDIDVLNQGDSWFYGYEYVDDEEIATPENEAYYNRSVVDIDIWLAKNGDSFDAKFVLTAKGKEDPDDEFELLSHEEVVYIIDGYLYVPGDGGVYEKSSIIPAEAQELFDKLSSLELVSAEEKDEMLKALGAEIATVFSIRDNKGSISFDAKPAIEELFAYIEALDMENDTIGGVLDDALKLVSEDLTSAAIVNELERLAGLTVNEALAELDAWLTANYETTLQGLYDSIVSNPDVVSLIENVFAAQNDLDLENPEDKEIVDAIIADIQALDFSDIIEEAGIGDVPLYDLIASSIASFSGSEEGPAYPAKDEIFAMVRSTLELTLAEFEENMGAPIFTFLKDAVSYLTVNKLNGKLDLNFSGLLSLVSIDGALNIDIESETPSEVAEKTNTTKLVFTMTLKVSEIGTTTLEIELPEDLIVIDNDLIEREFESEDGKLDINSCEDEEGNLIVNVHAYIYDENTGLDIRISATQLSYEDMLEDVITANNIGVYFEDHMLNVTEDSVFKFSVDTATGEFTVIEIPEYELPPMIEILIRGFGESMGTEYKGYTLDPSIICLNYYIVKDEYSMDIAPGIGLNSVTFTIEYNSETDALDCTIVGFTVDNKHSVKAIDGTYSSIGNFCNLEEINVYFGGDPTFSIYIDYDTNTLTCDEIPCILDEYKNNWP